MKSKAHEHESEPIQSSTYPHNLLPWSSARIREYRKKFTYIR